MMLFLFFYGSYYYVHVNVSQDSRQFFQFGLIYDLYLSSWKLSFTFVQVSRRQRERGTEFLLIRSARATEIDVIITFTSCLLVSDTSRILLPDILLQD